MFGILLLVAAFFSAILLNILVRVLGDENAKWEAGKSVLTMFIVYANMMSFRFLFALPRHIVIPLAGEVAGWFLLTFATVLVIYKMTATRTGIIAGIMTAFLSTSTSFTVG